mmetsp:Transcript_24279/g.49441  ORF Transcript_24279/g.49441 Transcript_24279/m.49441 type:complete len:202 (+) Transcript_24279:1501-2106(+)
MRGLGRMSIDRQAEPSPRREDSQSRCPLRATTLRNTSPGGCTRPQSWPGGLGRAQTNHRHPRPARIASGILRKHYASDGCPSRWPLCPWPRLALQDASAESDHRASTDPCRASPTPQGFQPCRWGRPRRRCQDPAEPRAHAVGPPAERAEAPSLASQRWEQLLSSSGPRGRRQAVVVPSTQRTPAWSCQARWASWRPHNMR